MEVGSQLVLRATALGRVTQETGRELRRVSSLFSALSVTLENPESLPLSDKELSQLASNPQFKLLRWDKHHPSPCGEEAEGARGHLLEIMEPLKTTESWKTPQKSSTPTFNQIPLCLINHRVK